MTLELTVPLNTTKQLRMIAKGDKPDQAINFAGVQEIIPFVANGIAATENYTWKIVDDILVKTLFIYSGAASNGSNIVTITIRDDVGINLFIIPVATNAMTKQGNLYYLVFPDYVYLRDNYQVYINSTYAIDRIIFNCVLSRIEKEYIGNKITTIPS